MQHAELLQQRDQESKATTFFLTNWEMVQQVWKITFYWKIMKIMLKISFQYAIIYMFGKNDHVYHLEMDLDKKWLC